MFETPERNSVVLMSATQVIAKVVLPIVLVDPLKRGYFTWIRP
jgi:hypothetical protein